MFLTYYFLEYPSNIECIEGEDATLTCKVRSKDKPVNWTKNGKAVTFNEYCTMSTEGTEHNLILRKVQSHDSGAYCMQVGKFSRKFHLKIIGINKMLFCYMFICTCRLRPILFCTN